jgi:hypothetical protein
MLSVMECSSHRIFLNFLCGLETTSFQVVLGLGNKKRMLGSKGGRCVGLINLAHSCADCLEIWQPELLEHSGPFQACNGIALLLLLPFYLRYFPAGDSPMGEF